MAQVGFEQPLTFGSIGIARPEKASRPLPHLSAHFSDITMDQALETVATTFGGIVIYKTCENGNGKGLISLEYEQIAGTLSEAVKAKSR